LLEILKQNLCTKAQISYPGAQTVIAGKEMLCIGKFVVSIVVITGLLSQFSFMVKRNRRQKNKLIASARPQRM
jgi:hypothetical protein